MADNINQQILNGTYRTVEILCIIAEKIGCPYSDVSKVKSDFDYHNAMADNIFQQINNGFYSSVKMLELIVRTLD